MNSEVRYRGLLATVPDAIVADDLRPAADALAQSIRTGIALVALRKDGSRLPRRARG